MLTKMKFTCLFMAASAALAGYAHAAPVFVTTGQTVTGTTTNLTLNAGSITVNSTTTGKTTLSNSSGNLVVTFGSGGDSTHGDFFLRWDGAGDGVGFGTATYTYVQIDVASVSAGMNDSNWQMFWQDDDSGIGGGNNSGVNIGGSPVDADQTTPFSLVIDLVNGTASGATGWGPGTLDKFRFDPFQGTANNGQTFTISAITFGSELTELPPSIPEPASVLMGGAGMALLALRRRAA